MIKVLDLGVRGSTARTTPREIYENPNEKAHSMREMRTSQGRNKMKLGKGTVEGKLEYHGKSLFNHEVHCKR